MYFVKCILKCIFQYKNLKKYSRCTSGYAMYTRKILWWKYIFVGYVNKEKIAWEAKCPPPGLGVCGS
jgi:hypothetical protein